MPFGWKFFFFSYVVLLCACASDGPAADQLCGDMSSLWSFL